MNTPSVKKMEMIDTLYNEVKGISKGMKIYKPVLEECGEILEYTFFIKFSDSLKFRVGVVKYLECNNKEEFIVDDFQRYIPYSRIERLKRKTLGIICFHI